MRLRLSLGCGEGVGVGGVQVCGVCDGECVVRGG